MERRRVSLKATGISRARILKHVLSEGAAWETPSKALLAHMFVVKKKNPRLGAKAAKQAERLESILWARPRRSNHLSGTCSKGELSGHG